MNTSFQWVTEIAYHSARMGSDLFLCSGKRPMRLSEMALAHELLPVVREMDRQLRYKTDIYSLSESSLKKTHDSARASLEKIDRIVDRSNDALYQDALQRAKEFRRLMNIARRLRSDASEYGSDFKKANDLYHTMLRENEELLTRTLVAAGFPPPEKPKENN